METIFEVRNTREEDYGTICDWWKWWRFPVWPRYALPDNLSDGIMVSRDGVNICCGFVYRTSSSSLFWMEFVVSNFEVKDRELRKEALELLINGLKYMAGSMGARVVYTSLTNKNLKKTYLDCGFLQGSTGCDELIYNVPLESSPSS